MTVTGPRAGMRVDGTLSTPAAASPATRGSSSDPGVLDEGGSAVRVRSRSGLVGSGLPGSPMDGDAVGVDSVGVDSVGVDLVGVDAAAGTPRADVATTAALRTAVVAAAVRPRRVVRTGSPRHAS
jgi:hypothetical protein